MTRSAFLIVTAIFEGGTGLALMFVPSMVIDLLFGANSPVPATPLAGILLGLPLLALGVACWVVRNGTHPTAQRRVLLVVLAYDVIAAVGLAYASLGLNATGIALWPAVAAHSGLTVWGVLCLRK